MKVLKDLLLILLLVFFQNCTKPVDFDQIDDASIDATYITTLIYLNLTAPNFVNEYNEEITVSSDVIEVPISDASEPYIEKVEFTVITESTFNRTFALSFIFYDSESNQIYTLEPIIIIPKNSPESTTILEIPNEDLHIIYNTRFIKSTIILIPSEDGTVLNANEIAEFKLKSSMKVFVNY